MGRHTTSKTPVRQRSCSFCHSNELTMGKHDFFAVIFMCRLELNNKVTTKYTCFNNFDHNSKVL